MATFTGVGCMSGSSLDGLDICYVEFTGDLDTDVWGHRIIKAKTVPYSPEWEERLRKARTLHSEDFVKLHVEYGHLIGKEVRDFIQTEGIESVDFVASHGHTVFHNPKLRYTFQLGDGETTAVYLNCPFVCNFRNKDLALGGEGAPFVPCGEKYLFSSSEICINLGGIANIGFVGKTGYDVSPCNYVSNRLALAYNPSMKYDEDGKIAKDGKIIPEVFRDLEDLPFYKQPPPKSLSAEWIEQNVMPILDTEKYGIADLLMTFYEHVAVRLSDACLNGSLERIDIKSKLLKEKFLVEETDSHTICFKEALVFAFLGLRCLLGEENILKDVTGSESDSVSGSVHLPVASQNTPGKLLRTNFELKRRRGRISCSFSID
ncbi:hypothetical protein FSP39_005424 [Pinctada imbricata]|uniref:Anhydro-N-acetylmuramic acid kinase n=1 Tax=Pinctada imbricata TaxID=66713 RepID=A0AA89C4W1_PINIB|nr:hypothetical protein FSP39_005424 [Pinctada imbricata]